LQEAVLRFATDGSFGGGLAAWGVAGIGGGAVAGSIGGEDLGAHSAELQAALHLLEALLEEILAQRAAGEWRRSAFPALVIYDCQNMAEFVQARCAPFERAGLFLQFGSLLRGLAESGCRLEWAWVPAHGRVVRGWRPHSLSTEAEMRELNASADAAAGRARLSALTRSATAAWHRGALQSLEWSRAALRFACLVQSRYQRYVDDAIASAGRSAACQQDADDADASAAAGRRRD
jgi:hypothetical protein